MILIAALVVTGITSTAFAGDFSAVLNGKSFHVGSKRDWNEKNYGLGLEYQLETRSRWKRVLFAGGFRDSERQMSYAAGAGLHRNLFTSRRLDGLYVDVGLNAFMMVREDVDGGRPFPGALPSMTVGNRFIGLNLSYIPRQAVARVSNPKTMDRDLEGIVFVQLKVNLSQLLERD